MLRRRLFLAAVPAVLATACTGTLPVYRQPALRFGDGGPLALRVSRLVVENRFQSPGQPPHVESRVSLPPDQALKDWARARLQPVGGPGQAVFRIDDASLLEERLPGSGGGLLGMMTEEATDRYVTLMRGRVMLLDDTGALRAETEASVERAVTVKESASFNERDQAWFALVQGALLDFNGEMERQMRQYMGPWLA